MPDPDTLVLEPSHAFEEGLTATRSRVAKLLVCVSVAEEQAVDSYNRSFTCSAHLSREQTTLLRDWLTAQLGGGESP